MYLYTSVIQMFRPYDDRGRLIGEDVWEPDPDRARITKLDAPHVLTTQQAAHRLNPLIKPLPSFEKRYYNVASPPGAARVVSVEEPA